MVRKDATDRSQNHYRSCRPKMKRRKTNPFAGQFPAADPFVSGPNRDPCLWDSPGRGVLYVFVEPLTRFPEHVHDRLARPVAVALVRSVGQDPYGPDTQSVGAAGVPTYNCCRYELSCERKVLTHGIELIHAFKSNWALRLDQESSHYQYPPMALTLDSNCVY